MTRTFTSPSNAPNPIRKKLTADVTDHNGNVWEDDSVEFSSTRLASEKPGITSSSTPRT